MTDPNPFEASPDDESRVGPIPTLFHRECERDLFEQCLVCDESLFDGRVYLIHKGIQVNSGTRGDRCVMEMALCLECAYRMHESFSEASRRTMGVFHAEKLRESLERDWPEEECCQFCGTLSRETTGYAAIGTCRQRSLISPTIHVCDGCESDLHERLSKETRGEIDRFRDEHFPGVPDLKLILT